MNNKISQSSAIRICNKPSQTCEEAVHLSIKLPNYCWHWSCYSFLSAFYTHIPDVAVSSIYKQICWNCHYQDLFPHQELHINLKIKAKVAERNNAYLLHAPFSDRALTSSAYEATPCISLDAYSQTKTNRSTVIRRLEILEFM